MWLWRGHAAHIQRSHTAAATRRRLPADPACGNEGWSELFATPDRPACDAGVFALPRAWRYRKPVPLPSEHAGAWPVPLRRPEAIRAERSGSGCCASRFPDWGMCASFASEPCTCLSESRIPVLIVANLVEPVKDFPSIQAIRDLPSHKRHSASSPGCNTWTFVLAVL